MRLSLLALLFFLLIGCSNETNTVIQEEKETNSDEQVMLDYIEELSDDVNQFVVYKEPIELDNDSINYLVVIQEKVDHELVEDFLYPVSTLTHFVVLTIRDHEVVEMYRNDENLAFYEEIGSGVQHDLYQNLGESKPFNIVNFYHVVQGASGVYQDYIFYIHEYDPELDTFVKNEYSYLVHYCSLSDEQYAGCETVNQVSHEGDARYNYLSEIYFEDYHPVLPNDKLLTLDQSSMPNYDFHPNDLSGFLDNLDDKIGKFPSTVIGTKLTELESEFGYPDVMHPGTPQSDDLPYYQYGDYFLKHDFNEVTSIWISVDMTIDEVIQRLGEPHGESIGMYPGLDYSTEQYDITFEYSFYDDSKIGNIAIWPLY